MDVRHLLEQIGLRRLPSALARRDAPAAPDPARLHRSPRVVGRRSFVSFVPFASFVVVASFLSCRGPEQRYTSLPARAAALKQQFNADAGKTRIVILPAPN